METIHEKLEPHERKLCKHTFTLIINLERHVAAIQKELKQNLCQLQNYSVKNVWDLRRHYDTIREQLKPDTSVTSSIILPHESVI